MERAARYSNHKPARLVRMRPAGTNFTLPEVSRKMMQALLEAGIPFPVDPDDVNEEEEEEEDNVVDIHSIVASAEPTLHKRRVYEVLHYWEALGLVRRAAGRGAYTWHGPAGYKRFRARLAAADPATTCGDFVASELSVKGWSHPQRLALALFYLLERPARVQLGESWDRDDFWQLTQEAAFIVQTPHAERLYYDALNMFMQLGVVGSRIHQSRTTCLMSWTPDGLSCRPVSDDDAALARHRREEESARIVDAVNALKELPVPDAISIRTSARLASKLSIAEGDDVPPPSPLSPEDKTISARVTNRRRKQQDAETAPVTVLKPKLARPRYIHDVNAVTSRPHRKRDVWVRGRQGKVYPSDPDPVPAPASLSTATTRAKKAKAAVSADPLGQIAEVPPPLAPKTAIKIRLSRPSVSTRSTDSSGSSGSGKDDNGDHPIQFACNDKAWSAFTDWANGDNTLPALFGDDDDALFLRYVDPE
jgi:hypothetical protein